MSIPFVSGIGGVLSADIAVPEHPQMVHFYSRVLGTGDAPLWREDLMNNLGVPIIGLGARSPEHARLPLQWMPHIQVADVGDSVAIALGLGGDELMHARNDEGESQWAVLLDPSGAAFGLIPVVSPDALPAMDDDVATPGRIAWLDLTVADAAATRDFYQQVVGWTAKDVKMADESGQYVDFDLCGDDGVPAARVRHARGSNAGLPPIWMIHLPVGDLEQSLKRVRREGGTVIKSSPGSDAKNACAAIRDPAGACLALVAG